LEKGLSSLDSEVDVVVIQYIAKVAQIKAKIFSAYAPDGKSELSLFAIPCQIKDESRSEVLHPYSQHLSRFSVYFIHPCEKIKGGSNTLSVVGVHGYLDELPDLFVGGRFHPSMEEGPPDKLIGVLYGGGLRCAQENAVIRDEEEL
jgi:hypothetical protein